MAHFAILDENNVVTNVIVVSNKELLDENGNENEQLGIMFIKNLYNDQNLNLKQTSYNHNFRKRYAGIGMIYSEEHDAFISECPFPSWTFSTVVYDWEPPVPYPQDGNDYYWDEPTLTWINFNQLQQVQ